MLSSYATSSLDEQNYHRLTVLKIIISPQFCTSALSDSMNGSTIQFNTEARKLEVIQKSSLSLTPPLTYISHHILLTLPTHFRTSVLSLLGQSSLLSVTELSSTPKSQGNFQAASHWFHYRIQTQGGFSFWLQPASPASCLEINDSNVSAVLGGSVFSLSLAFPTNIPLLASIPRSCATGLLMRSARSHIGKERCLPTSPITNSTSPITGRPCPSFSPRTQALPIFPITTAYSPAQSPALSTS